MNAGLVGSAIAMFAVTNIDDILLLSLYFGQAKGRTDQELQIVLGQYVGFVGILAVSVVGAYGASLLSGDVVAYLGLVPLLLGVRAAIDVWRSRDRPAERVQEVEPNGPTIHHVGAITFANGGDNIGVYIPVFAAVGAGGIAIYTAVFLVGVAIWCAAGRFLATRPPVARLLNRWGHIILPVVLIAIGVILLVHGGAFGL